MDRRLVELGSLIQGLKASFSEFVSTWMLFASVLLFCRSISPESCGLSLSFCLSPGCTERRSRDGSFPVQARVCLAQEEHFVQTFA